MATTIIQFSAPAGLTLTADIYPDGSDTPIDTGVSCTEETNRDGVYTLQHTGSETGLLQLIVKAGTAALGDAWVYVAADDTSTYHAAPSRADATSAQQQGPGSRELTWTTKKSGNAVANVEAWITTDASGTNTVGGTYLTDDSGIARVPGGTGKPMIDDDVTYYGWRDSPTNQFSTNPIQFRYSSADAEFQLHDGSNWNTWDGVSNDASAITGGSSTTSVATTAGKQINVSKGRGITKDLTIVRADGTTIIPQTNDKIRVVIGREGRTAKLVVTSDEATENGSTFTKGGGGGAKNRLRLDASDLTFASGVYTMWFEMFDYEDSQEWKLVSKHIFSLED